MYVYVKFNKIVLIRSWVVQGVSLNLKTYLKCWFSFWDCCLIRLPIHFDPLNHTLFCVKGSICLIFFLIWDKILMRICNTKIHISYQLLWDYCLFLFIPKIPKKGWWSLLQLQKTLTHIVLCVWCCVQEWECLIVYGHTQKDKIMHVNYESKKAFPSKTTFVRTLLLFLQRYMWLSCRGWWSLLELQRHSHFVYGVVCKNGNAWLCVDIPKHVNLCTCQLWK